MTSAEFMDLWRSLELRQYVVDEAKRRNRLPQLQEEYCQEAWLLISCAPAGYDLAAYKELAERAIRASWWQTRREYVLMRAMDQHVNAAMCVKRAGADGDGNEFMRD